MIWYLTRCFPDGSRLFATGAIELTESGLIFDFVLRSRISGEGGHRAEADRVIRGGQNLEEAVQKGRRNEEPGSPERIPARTQQRIVASCKTSPK